MKKFLLSILCFLSVSIFAVGQEDPKVLKLTDGVYSYEKVFEVPGKTKEQIFESIKGWVIANVKTQSNTNYFDEKNYSITTTPAFTCSYSSWIDFKVNIDVKDGKYRLTAGSFIWHNMQGIAKSFGDYSGITMKTKNRQQVQDDVEGGFVSMLTGIESVNTKKSDW